MEIIKEKLINLNKTIFATIKGDVICIEEEKKLEEQGYKVLQNEYERLEMKINYPDKDNISRYFNRLISLNRVLIASALFSGLNLERLEKNTNLLLDLHLSLQTNLLYQKEFGSIYELLDESQKKKLTILKGNFHNDKSIDSDLTGVIIELINDLDRGTYSKDFIDYRNNKRIRIKALNNKDNIM